jgi:hypothetical protein
MRPRRGDPPSLAPEDAAAQVASKEPMVGGHAPEIVPPDLDGATVSLTHFRVLIDEPGRIASELAEGGPAVLTLVRVPQKARVDEKVLA